MFLINLFEFFRHSCLLARGRGITCQSRERTTALTKFIKMSKVFQILGESFTNKNGDSIALEKIQGQGKVIAVYFSAHWCPPCRSFTPKLANFYGKVKQSQNGDKFELIFLSSDRTEEEFKEYLGQMPWYSLSYDKRSEKVYNLKYTVSL